MWALRLFHRVGDAIRSNHKRRLSSVRLVTRPQIVFAFSKQVTSTLKIIGRIAQSRLPGEIERDAEPIVPNAILIPRDLIFNTCLDFIQPNSDGRKFWIGWIHLNHGNAPIDVLKRVFIVEAWRSHWRIVVTTRQRSPVPSIYSSFAQTSWA
jgi:hypothetical protein